MEILRTTELSFCVITVATALSWLAWQSVTRSSDYYQRIDQFKPVIDQGWLPYSHGIDLTDRQWKTFRAGLSTLLPFLLLSVFVRKSICTSRNINFYSMWGIIFVVVLHGSGVVWLAVCMVTNYCVLVALDKTYLSVIWTWSFGLGLLFSSKISGLEYWQDALEPIGLDWIVSRVRFATIFGPQCGFMDNMYKGIYSWENPLNLVFLRLISFNIEYWRSRRKSEDSTGASGDGVCYTFQHFVGYMLYPPLYIAGLVLNIYTLTIQNLA